MRLITLNLIYNISFGIEKGTLEPSLLDIPFVRALEAMNEIALQRFMDSWWKIKHFFKEGAKAIVVKNVKKVDDFTYNVIRIGRSKFTIALRKLAREFKFQALTI
jgi:hypothetical protein